MGLFCIQSDVNEIHKSWSWSPTPYPQAEAWKYVNIICSNQDVELISESYVSKVCIQCFRTLTSVMLTTTDSSDGDILPGSY